MHIIIFDLTADNQMMFFTPDDKKVYRQEIDGDIADVLRKHLDEEIMIRTYIDEISFEAIGTIDFIAS